MNARIVHKIQKQLIQPVNEIATRIPWKVGKKIRTKWVFSREMFVPEACLRP
jgi:hypothetical protein